MLIAVDTNVLLDLAAEIDDVADAIFVRHRRVRKCQMVIPPTVREELAQEAIHGEMIDKMEKARVAFQMARSLNIRPLDLPGFQHDAALLKCAILLTSEEHLRGLDFTRLAFGLQACDSAQLSIATPREIVHKFFI